MDSEVDTASVRKHLATPLQKTTCSEGKAVVAGASINWQNPEMLGSHVLSCKASPPLSPSPPRHPGPQCCFQTTCNKIRIQLVNLFSIQHAPLTFFVRHETVTFDTDHTLPLSLVLS